MLDNMKLGDNIAKNIALRENVFMMAVCIELRIPLFLVGKPGSSKSLAKSIVTDSMLGRSSEKDLMKEFKQVELLCPLLVCTAQFILVVLYVLHRSRCSPTSAVSSPHQKV